MARLAIYNLPRERHVVIALSRRDLLALLRKLDMPGAARHLESDSTHENGILRPVGADGGPGVKTTLVVLAEADDEHYGECSERGSMHPASGQVISEHDRVGAE